MLENLRKTYILIYIHTYNIYIHDGLDGLGELFGFLPGLVYRAREILEDGSEVDAAAGPKGSRNLLGISIKCGERFVVRIMPEM